VIEVVAALLELTFRNRTPRGDSLLKSIEIVGGTILIFGLAMEFRGHKRENLMLDKQNGALYSLAEKMRERSDLLESNNLVLQKEVLILKSPRTIKPQQMDDFKVLTALIKKIPITISIGQEGADTETYAMQLRQMFAYAHFESPTNSGLWGISRYPGRVQARLVGVQNEFNFVEFLFFSTNNPPLPESVPVITIGPDHIPIVPNSGTTEDVFHAIFYVFQKMGISSKFVLANEWLKPGEFEVFIPLKNQ